MDTHGVDAALDLLLEEIGKVAKAIDAGVNYALANRRVDEARKLLEDLIRVDQFRKRVEELQRELPNLFAASAQGATQTAARPRGRQRKGRLPVGRRTPQKAYRRPILEALVEMGGRARMEDVLARVAEKMRPALNQYDYEPLPKSRVPRWEKTAQWCRYELVQEGLMERSSPYGIWEISEAGRRALESGQA